MDSAMLARRSRSRWHDADCRGMNRDWNLSRRFRKRPGSHGEVGLLHRSQGTRGSGSARSVVDDIPSSTVRTAAAIPVPTRVIRAIGYGRIRSKRLSPRLDPPQPRFAVLAVTGAAASILLPLPLGRQVVEL